MPIVGKAGARDSAAVQQWMVESVLGAEPWHAFWLEFDSVAGSELAELRSKLASREKAANEKAELEGQLAAMRTKLAAAEQAARGIAELEKKLASAEQTLEELNGDLVALQEENESLRAKPA